MKLSLALLDSSVDDQKYENKGQEEQHKRLSSQREILSSFHYILDLRTRNSCLAKECDNTSMQHTHTFPQSKSSHGLISSYIFSQHCHLQQQGHPSIKISPRNQPTTSKSESDTLCLPIIIISLHLHLSSALPFVSEVGQTSLRSCLYQSHQDSSTGIPHHVFSHAL